MPAKYINITAEEMASFLVPQGFELITLPNTRELVYGKLIKHEGLTLSLRVYTGIEPQGDSREVGTDAIRADLWWRQDKLSTPKRVGSSKRVHRVHGWRENLQNRLDNWLEYSPIKCKCGFPMVKRKGKFGLFYGCTNYPMCKNLVPIN